MGVASRQPFDIAGLEFSGHRALSFDVAAQIEIGDRNYQMRAIVMVAGHRGARFEFNLGDADSIFHEKNLAAAARESLFASLLRPMGWRLPQFVILHQFNRHVAEGLVGEIPGDVGKVSWRKPGAAVLGMNLHRRFALDFVGEVSIAECDGYVVVAMPVHERRGMGRNLDLEGANVLVVDGKVVRRLSGDLDFSRGLRRQEWNQQEEKQYALHGWEL